MKDRKEINVDELLKTSDEAVLKMGDIFSEFVKNNEFADNKEIKELEEKLVKIKEKRG